jgi:hypothetical protein
MLFAIILKSKCSVHSQERAILELDRSGISTPANIAHLSGTGKIHCGLAGTMLSVMLDAIVVEGGG